jgi:hypothetical protein
VALKLPKLDKTMGMVEFQVKDPKTGKLVPVQGIPTPDFQRWWQSAVVRSDSASTDVETKVNTKEITYTAPTISNPPTQAQVQAIANVVEQMAAGFRNE